MYIYYEYSVYAELSVIFIQEADFIPIGTAINNNLITDNLNI